MKEKLIQRYKRSERINHWIVAVCFMLLAISGLAFFYPAFFWLTGVFGTPIAGLGNKIALTAWTDPKKAYYRNGNYGIGHIAVCTGFDQRAFAAFRDAFRGKGPEGTPLALDAPGMGPQ